MWNLKQAQQHDDSWEVRAFEEDKGTWPPRSYTCSFCRREFRSAQALGGHMNVHRRDRARLHQTTPVNYPNPMSAATSTSGLCLLYQLPNSNGVRTPSSALNASAIDAPSTFCSISPYPDDYHVASPMVNSFQFHQSIGHGSGNFKNLGSEELDLELRLGQKSTSPSTS